MTVSPQVMQQVQYDAAVGAKNMPQNAFQRAANFLKNSISKIKGNPSAPVSSATQVARDAKAGGKALKAYQATKTAGGLAKGAKGVIGAVKGTPGLGTALTAGTAIGLYVDSQRKPGEKGWVSGRGEGRRAVQETGGGGHIPVTTYADGSPIPVKPRVTSSRPNKEQEDTVRDRFKNIGKETPNLPDKDPGEINLGLGGGGGGGGNGNGTGRGTPAPNGGSGTGTQMSPGAMTMDEANSLLTGGYKVMNPFSNTQLPATAGNPYQGDGKTVEFRSDAPEDTYSQRLSGDLLDKSPFETPGVEFTIPKDTSISYSQKAGSPNIVQSGVQTNSETVDSNEDPQNSGINWGARTAADNSDPNIARRRAFLDAEDSLQGLRRIEGQKGIVYAGGTYNMVNPNQGEEGQNDFVRISKEDRDGYMAGRQSPEQMREKYMAKVADAQQPKPDTSDDDDDRPMTIKRGTKFDGQIVY